MNCEGWIGFSISIDCGETLGTFQGHVSSVDSKEQTISLVKVFRNGLHCPVPEITISARDIRNLSILGKVSEKHETRKTNEEIGRKYINKTPPNSQSPMKASEYRMSRSLSQPGSETRKKPGTPRKSDGRRKWHDQEDDCLNVPIEDHIFQNEFDFEKNLALFDKQAVFDEIDAAVKPDVVKLADERRGDSQAKYRCDESVLKQLPVVHRQIQLTNAGRHEFVTDMGLIVPSVSFAAREKIQSTAEKLGFSRERQTELYARAVSDMLIQILGGSRRLNPNNSHQIPSVVILSGICTQGFQALSCGRHLASHGINVTAYLPLLSISSPPVYKQEIELFKLTSGHLTQSIEDLPTGPIDAVICALDGHSRFPGEQSSPWYKMAVAWATNCKAPILTIDPPADGTMVNTKWSLVPVLPLDVDVSSCGSIYLCDVAIPQKVFSAVGISYQSPFGPKSVIPLHQNI